MKQVGLDRWALSEVNGYRHRIVCIDYFIKWSKVKPIIDRTVLTVATFFIRLYVVISVLNSK